MAPDLRTRGARIADRVAAVGWPILVVLFLLGAIVFYVVREAKLWGLW